jgi:hypothetical protein
MKKIRNTAQNTPFKETVNITRKEALKKAGKYAAFTAASMLIILSPKESQAGSQLPQNPGNGW